METKLLQIHVPVELREKLKQLAKLEQRAMSRQALVILEEEVEKRLREAQS